MGDASVMFAVDRGPYITVFFYYYWLIMIICIYIYILSRKSYK